MFLALSQPANISSIIFWNCSNALLTRILISCKDVLLCQLQSFWYLCYFHVTESGGIFPLDRLWWIHMHHWVLEECPLFIVFRVALTIALFAWRMSKQRRIVPSSFGIGTNGFNQDVNPFTGSMISSFKDLSTSSSTLHLVKVFYM